MQELSAQNVYCPYCGELIEVLIDCSEPQQDYIEDCQVCCCPIGFHVAIELDGTPHVSVSHEND